MSPAVGAPQLVYGPVPSRRLGRSLGVDLVPFKTCTYDCVYCQLGRTTARQYAGSAGSTRRMSLLRCAPGSSLSPTSSPSPGLGEPTLHAGIGDVIAGIKRLTDVPVAVITNGSLLSRPTVRQGLADADIVLPSLDAPDDGLFQLVNRPHKGSASPMWSAGWSRSVAAIAEQVWLEVMLLARRHGRGGPKWSGSLSWRVRIAPDRIQLNTAVRPPAESSVAPVAHGSSAGRSPVCSRPTPR